MAAILLTGQFNRSIDEKMRVAIPKPLREPLRDAVENGLFLAPGTDTSLSVYPRQSLLDLADQLDGRSPAARDVRAFRRMFFASVRPVELDRQWRMRIPSDLHEWAGLGKEIVLVGVGEHLELWDGETWQRYLADKQEHYDEIVESTFGGVPSVGADSANSHSAVRPR